MQKTKTNPLKRTDVSDVNTFIWVSQWLMNQPYWDFKVRHCWHVGSVRRSCLASLAPVLPRRCLRCLRTHTSPLTGWAGLPSDTGTSGAPRKWFTGPNPVFEPMRSWSPRRGRRRGETLCICCHSGFLMPHTSRLFIYFFCYFSAEVGHFVIYCYQKTLHQLRTVLDYMKRRLLAYFICKIKHTAKGFSFFLRQ